MSWDGREYIKLVVAKYGQPAGDDLKKYIPSLQWNLVRKINLHKGVIKRYWDIIYKKSISSIQDKEYKEAYFLSMAEGEAIVHALHSTADVLAHLVNIILDTDKLSFEQVSFGKVQKKLRLLNIAPGVLVKMDALFNTNEFQYIKAFCNTVKHYHLIPAFDRTHYGYKNKTFTQGMRFKEFPYRGNLYPEVYLHDIYGRYADEIEAKIVAIGNELNTSLR